MTDQTRADETIGDRTSGTQSSISTSPLENDNAAGSPLPDLDSLDAAATRNLILSLSRQIRKQQVLIDLSKRSGHELNLPRLLEIIVNKSSEVVDAERSTLFILDENAARLWTIVAEGLEARDSVITIPLGKGIAGHVALTREQVIVNEVYGDERFDQTVDLRTGYRTRNLVATPLIGHNGQVLGVLEVINKRSGAFSREDAGFLTAFASSAAVHVETAELHGEIEHLFDSFINVVAHAIDERDPATAGHSRRVKTYSFSMAREIDRMTTGPLASFRFDADRLRQLEIAALMHDVGKIGVRENVLNKKNRLSDDAVLVICQRLDLFLAQRRLEHVTTGADLPPEEEVQALAATEFIRRVTTSGSLTAEDIRRLGEIRARGWLSESEYELLAVSKGNLTDSEWVHLKSHVTKSHQLLAGIPWPRALRSVPEIAHCHHEKLDGSGYPRGLKADRIPLEAQIVAIADIYDALTAHDRPYKPPMPHDRAAEILLQQASLGLLNSEVVRLFLDRELYKSIEK